MHHPEQLQAFVTAVETGSFSAAGRRLGKAQSAISTAIMNMEMDLGVELFDRSSRSPVLTERGRVLLKYAEATIRSHREMAAIANAMGERQESHLGLALEQGTYTRAVGQVLVDLQQQFPYLEVEVFDPGAYDVAELMLNGRADIGIMSEKDDYPNGYYYKGIGHTLQVPVCSRSHPLAQKAKVSHEDLRQYQQFVMRSRYDSEQAIQGIIKSPQVWYSESPYLILDMVMSGLGWTEIPWSVAAEKLPSGELVVLQYEFLSADNLHGIDLVWTEQRALGAGGSYLLQRLQQLGPRTWLPDDWQLT